MNRPGVIYTKKANGRLYQVLRTSAGILISINGTASTQSVGGSGPTGLYYDEIAQAIPNEAKSCLLLGVAGATVARRAQELGKTCEFIGVDNDPEMIKICDLFFSTRKYVSKIFIADARKFVLDHAPASFDCVIDDLYVDAFNRVAIDARRLVRRGGYYITHDLASGRVLIEKL